jgi:hypothetical protein
MAKTLSDDGPYLLRYTVAEDEKGIATIKLMVIDRKHPQNFTLTFTGDQLFNMLVDLEIHENKRTT